jgi:hypothetical protein
VEPPPPSQGTAKSHQIKRPLKSLEAVQRVGGRKEREEPEICCCNNIIVMAHQLYLWNFNYFRKKTFRKRDRGTGFESR